MTINGKIYYFGGDGMIASDTYYIDGNWYLADASGARVLTKGWYWQKGYWYYVTLDGIQIIVLGANIVFPFTLFIKYFSIFSVTV